MQILLAYIRLQHLLESFVFRACDSIDQILNILKMFLGNPGYLTDIVPISTPARPAVSMTPVQAHREPLGAELDENFGDPDDMIITWHHQQTGGPEKKEYI